jgi:hypothetical protein
MDRPNATSMGSLLNLGPQSTRWLASIGITTTAQLRRAGAVAAYVEVKRLHAGVSMNLLYALAGALEERHWSDVRRTQRLELLLAVEAYEERHPARPAPAGRGLLGLRNIGPAMHRDLQLLGITSVAALARSDADALFTALERKTGKRQDPCVWDTFAAAILQARTGQARPWWYMTPERKARQAAGLFPPRPKPARSATHSRPVKSPRAAAPLAPAPAPVAKTGRRGARS